MRIVAIIIPVIVAFISVLCNVIGTDNGWLPMPRWNDEAAYYELLKTWLETGQPMGYWGFDGGHALVGTGSAWSSAILFPYAVFAMMFGLNHSTVFFANIFFMCIANALFILLVNPDKKQCGRIVLVQIFSVITILYSQALMSEMLRYSLIIIMAGMLYRLYFSETGKWFKYVLVPIYMILIIQVYIFMVFVVPLYIFAICRKWKFWKKAIVALGATGVVGGASYFLLHLISSNYNIYKTEILLEALKKADFIAIIRALVWMVKEGLWGLYSCFLTGSGYGMFKWFLLFLLLLVVIPFAEMGIRHFKKKKGNLQIEDVFWTKDRQMMMMVAFSICLYVAAYITVYSLEPFTFFRGVGITVIFAMYLFTKMDNRKLFTIILVCYAVGMIFLPRNFQYFSEERYLNEEQKAEWTTLEEELSRVIEINAKKSEWENTVAIFTLEPKVIAAIPGGAGVNMMLYTEEIPQDAGYLLFSLEKEKLRSDWLEHDYYAIYEANAELLDNHYEEVYRSEEYLVYQKSN